MRFQYKSTTYTIGSRRAVQYIRHAPRHRLVSAQLRWTGLTETGALGWLTSAHRTSCLGELRAAPLWLLTICKQRSNFLHEFALEVKELCQHFALALGLH